MEVLVLESRRTPFFIISPASGMQPPLVQRRSSDAGLNKRFSAHALKKQMIHRRFLKL